MLVRLSDRFAEASDSALTVLPGLSRFPRLAGPYLAATRSLAIVAVAALFLLCACSAEQAPTANPTRAAPASATRTALPTPYPASPVAPTPLSSPLPPVDLAIEGPELVRAVPGETTVYTLAIQNRGSTLATGIVLTDVLPAPLRPLWTEPALPLCRRIGRSVICDAGDLQEGGAISISLDISVGGSDETVSSARLGGLGWDLSAPACAIEEGVDTPSFWCHLASLAPGHEAQVRLGLTVDAGAEGPLVHTASIRANEHDTNRWDNHAVLTVTVGADAAVPSETVALTATPDTTDLVVEADGPATIIAGQPFSYTYTITNRGAAQATSVNFEDALPPATTLLSFSPRPPRCEQGDETLTCYLQDPASHETVTFTVAVSEHGGQPMRVDLDPLMPGWPICTVLREREHLHIVKCELGGLSPGQSTQVELGLVAGGVLERTIANAASVTAAETEQTPIDNTAAITTSVRVSADVAVQSEVIGLSVAGDALTYTLTAINLGPSDADVVLTDTLPVGTRLISATSGRGDDCRVQRQGSAEDTIVCSLGRLRSGETVTVAAVVAVEQRPIAVKDIRHSARVEARQPDPNPANNVVTESIPVSAGADD